MSDEPPAVTYNASGNSGAASSFASQIGPNTKAFVEAAQQTSAEISENLKTADNFWRTSAWPALKDGFKSAQEGYLWVKGVGIPRFVEGCKESKRFVEETVVPATQEARCPAYSPRHPLPRSASHISNWLPADKSH